VAGTEKILDNWLECSINENRKSFMMAALGTMNVRIERGTER
jgi:hypothetical protein